MKDRDQYSQTVIGTIPWLAKLLYNNLKAKSYEFPKTFWMNILQKVDIKQQILQGTHSPIRW